MKHMKRISSSLCHCQTSWNINLVYTSKYHLFQSKIHPLKTWENLVFTIPWSILNPLITLVISWQCTDDSCQFVCYFILLFLGSVVQNLPNQTKPMPARNSCWCVTFTQNVHDGMVCLFVGLLGRLSVWFFACLFVCLFSIVQWKRISCGFILFYLQCAVCCSF